MYFRRYWTGHPRALPGLWQERRNYAEQAQPVPWFQGHSMLETDNGITLMAADTPKSTEYRPGSNVSISLSGDNEKELKSYWEKLSPGATIRQPREKAPWGDTFGMPQSNTQTLCSSGTELAAAARTSGLMLLQWLGALIQGIDQLAVGE
jgi:hypothetical protein